MCPPTEPPSICKWTPVIVVNITFYFLCTFWNWMSKKYGIHFPPAASNSQDFKTEAKIADQLLAHFTRTWEDRQVYYLARERAKVQRDLMTLIVDSYDHSKLSLPKWPMARCPKRSLYENTRRNLKAIKHFSGALFVFNLSLCHNCLFDTCFVHWGTYLTLTGCIVHGVGVYMYLSDEGMPGGSNWTLECATHLQIKKWARTQGIIIPS